MAWTLKVHGETICESAKQFWKQRSIFKLKSLHASIVLKQVIVTTFEGFPY